MTSVSQIIGHLLEDGETLTLNQWLQDNEPDQWVLDNEILEAELDVPMLVKEVDPAVLVCNETPLPKAVRVASKPPHARIVKRYMRNPGGPILLDGQRILDGQHRAMAAFLAKRPVKAINLADMDIQEDQGQDQDNEDDWKDVEPPVAAKGVSRWVFTERELSNPNAPTWCSANDSFFAEVEGCELEVLVYRDGTVSDKWGDGTYGVPPDIRELADGVETLIKPTSLQKGANDVYADTWLDVYVGEDGHFLAFVDPPRSLGENDEEDFETQEVASEPYSLYSPTKPGDAMTAPFRVVLHGSYKDREWVVHLQNMNDKSYFWGHYFMDDDYAGAVADFRERCKQYDLDPDQAERVLAESQLVCR